MCAYAPVQAAAVRQSLNSGKLLLDPKDFSPLKNVDKRTAAPLAEKDRMFLIMKMTAYQRIHALRNCLDRDHNAEDFMPWTQVGATATTISV